MTRRSFVHALLTALHAIPVLKLFKPEEVKLSDSLPADEPHTWRRCYYQRSQDIEAGLSHHWSPTRMMDMHVGDLFVLFDPDGSACSNKHRGVPMQVFRVLLEPHLNEQGIPTVEGEMERVLLPADGGPHGIPGLVQRVGESLFVQRHNLKPGDRYWDVSAGDGIWTA